MALAAERRTDDEGPQVVFSVQPGPQTALVLCPITEIFYGGARGGGKTFGFLLDWVMHASRFGNHAKGIIFRRTYDELDEVVAAARKIMSPIGSTWRSGARIMHMPDGAELKFRYLNRDDDAERYQGHQYSWIAFDEVTNWATPAAINKLRACLRSADVPPSGLRFLLSGNPGGVGHNWVKARYIDPARPFEIVRELDGDTGIELRRVFIPSLYKDNPALAANDPGYLARLKDSGPEWLVKAWIEGDWSIVAGGMFDDVLDLHTPHQWKNPVSGEVLTWGKGNICEPFVIPASWRVDRCFDWGSARPFSVIWHAESDGTPAVAANGARIEVPRGTLFAVSEYYGCTGTPNVGLKMLATEVADEILVREKILKETLLKHHSYIRPGPADSAIWNSENGVTIADDMEKRGVKWTPADKRPGSRKTGWEAMRQAFKAANSSSITEPAYIAFSTCREWWRVVPTTPRDKRDVEDVDTDYEDHILDAARYRVQEVRRIAVVKKLKGL